MSRRPFDPPRDRRPAVEKLLDARAAGGTVRQAAAAAGVHSATLCRWQLLSAVFATALRLAAAAARERRRLLRPCRPWVTWHPACPECGADVEVRNPAGDWTAKFWICTKRPACAWKGWRPRYPRDCPGCKGPRFWSHSRKSVSCRACGTRGPADPAFSMPIPADRHPLPPPPATPTAAELLARAAAEVAAPGPRPAHVPDGWQDFARGGPARVAGAAPGVC